VTENGKRVWKKRKITAVISSEKGGQFKRFRRNIALLEGKGRKGMKNIRQGKKKKERHTVALTVGCWEGEDGNGGKATEINWEKGQTEEKEQRKGGTRNPKVSKKKKTGRLGKWGRCQLLLLVVIPRIAGKSPVNDVKGLMSHVKSIFSFCLDPEILPASHLD